MIERNYFKLGLTRKSSTCALNISTKSSILLTFCKSDFYCYCTYCLNLNISMHVKKFVNL